MAGNNTDEIDNPNGQVGTGRKERVRKVVTPLLIILVVIAVIIVLFLYGRDMQKIAALGDYGYFGAFLISLIGNGTILLPGIVLPLLSGLGSFFYPVKGIMGPVLVGVAGGAGAAVGEIVGYLAGYSGRGIVENRRLYNILVDWVRRWGSLAVFVFALVPLFFDLVGLAAGLLRFPLWKFVIVCWLGRTILYVAFVVLVALGWGAVLTYFS